jgi:hypothetical protein
MPTAISPEHYLEDFPSGLTLDDMIVVYGAQVKGWQLDPAQTLLDRENEQRDVQASFAVLHIVMSYFEATEKLRDGYCQDKKSGFYFKKGFERVFQQEIRKMPQLHRAEVLDLLYERVRCGLYHAAGTGPRVTATHDITEPIDFIMNNGDPLLSINPRLIVPRLKEFHSTYLQDLKNPSKRALRRNFEKRFTWLSKVKKSPGTSRSKSVSAS